MNEVAPGVFRVNGPDLKMSAGMVMPLSATVLRLADRSLAIYSPVAFTDEQVAAIDAAGEVAHVVAPNLLHYLYAGAAHARWPRATLWASPSLIAKSLAEARPIAEAALPGVEAELVGGAPKLDETVLFHAASATVVCADFVFHIPRGKNLVTRMVLAMTGVGGGKLAQSRIWSFVAKDKAAVARSFARILDWPIARVSPTHGEAGEIVSADLAQRLKITGTRSLPPPHQPPAPAPGR